MVAQSPKRVDDAVADGGRPLVTLGSIVTFILVLLALGVVLVWFVPVVLSLGAAIIRVVRGRPL